MTKRFQTAEATLAYMTECNLATVEQMATKKGTPKGEFKRQIEIAQVGVSFLLSIAARVDGRVLDVIADHGGKVASWAEAQKL